MSIFIFIFILLSHWIADFVFQDEKWALGKSKKLEPLLLHTITYSGLWIVPVWLITGEIWGTVLFVGVTFLLHTLTDYYTSPIVSKRFEDKYYGSPIPNFGAFSVIGFDQFLHYTQLVITWYLIFGI